jgi:hypothetical protein
VQHRQVAAPQLQVLGPHLSRVLEQYCSLVLYIPEGIVRVHNVSVQEQQMQQKGQAQQRNLQPKEPVETHAPQEGVEEQQVVLLTVQDGHVVGPITFALPGYNLLFRLLGLNGGIRLYLFC